MLDMVCSTMSRPLLPISLWGYALETATHILNLVPIKKVAKTPHEMWTRIVPNLDHVKIWGCEDLVRCESHDTLETQSERCIFISYPHRSFGYLFYRPSDNVVFVARRGVFREREFISQGNSGRQIDLEEIQESSGEGTSNPSTQLEEETPVEPIEKSVPLRCSTRVRNAPEHYYGFHIIVEGETLISDETLVSLDEPNNYAESMVGPESAKWKEAMDNEI